MKKFLWPGMGRRDDLPSSVATQISHIPAGRLPGAEVFARRSQTPLLCRDGLQLAFSYPHFIPFGLPGGIRIDRGPFATGPCFSRKGHASRFPGCITGPCKLLLTYQPGSAQFITT